MTNTCNAMELNIEVLETITGGSNPKDHPQYQEIKDFYKEKGMQPALLLAVYFGITGDDLYNMINLIGDELEHGV